MYGAGQGSLQVQGSANGCTEWTTIWQTSGNHGQGWHSATAVPILSGYDVYDCVRFLGRTGSNYTSDMALDDVNVNIAPSPTAFPTITLLPTAHLSSVPSAAPTKTPCNLRFEGLYHGVGSDQLAYFEAYAWKGPDSNQNPFFESISGKFVYPIADEFYVQWPQLTLKYPKALFKGTVV